MTILFHMILSFMISYTLINNFIVASIAAIVGGLPDIYPWLKWLIFEKRNPELRWKTYNDIHLREINLWEWIFAWPWALHIYLDKFVHHEDGGWNERAIVVEVIGWLFILISMRVLFG